MHNNIKFIRQDQQMWNVKACKTLIIFFLFSYVSTNTYVVGTQ